MMLNILGRKPLVDCHCHILPTMDDGAKTVKESIMMLRQERMSGVTDVCLTPHYYWHENSVSAFLERRRIAYGLLSESLRKALGRFPSLHLGAEVAYYDGISSEPLLERLGMGASNCILFEPPMKEWESSMIEELVYIKEELGFQPVIAHVDRYMRFFDDYSLEAVAHENGFLVQCNASFFLEKSSSAAAVKLLRKGKVNFIGSDAHNVSDREVTLSRFYSLCRKERLMPKVYTMSKKNLSILQNRAKNKK